MTKRNALRLSRRGLLLGGGAAGLSALPLLDAFSFARAASASPKRFVFIYTPNGTIQDAFWPTMGEGGDSDFSLNTITAPFEPFKQKLTFLKGLDLSITDMGPGGPHQRGMGGLLTGRELQSGDFVGGDGSLAGWANGPSIDQLIARTVGQTTLFSSLELGVRANEAEVRGRMVYSDAAMPLPPINSPQQTYDRVFAGVVDVSPEKKARRQRVVDALHPLYQELQGRVSLADRDKLEQHLDMVRGIERRLETALEPGECSSPPQPPEMEADHEDTMEQVCRLQLELMAAAMACDVSRVFTLQMSSAINAIRFPWLDSTKTGHNLSHAGETDDLARKDLIKRSTWYAQRIAEFLAILEAVPEGDGTMLDNTVVLWGNELGIGNTHSLTNIPFMMAGGAGGYFKTGRMLDYGGVPHNALLVSMAQAMGLELDSFGHPDFATGPLPGLT